MRFLLITLLATVAAATYEYDAEEARAVRTQLYANKVYKFRGAEVINVDALSEWNVMQVDTGTDVHFQITEFIKSSGYNCGGGPAIRIKKIQYCLFKIAFHTDIRNGKEILQYGLIFRNSEHYSEWSLVTSNVYAKTADYQQIPLESVFVEPISKEHLVGARDNTPFQMNTAWLTAIVDQRLYTLNERTRDKIIGNLDMKFKMVYYTLPLVMNVETVNEIVYLASLWSEQPPKNEITDVAMYTKAMMAEWARERYGKEE